MVTFSLFHFWWVPFCLRCGQHMWEIGDIKVRWILEFFRKNNELHGIIKMIEKKKKWLRNSNFKNFKYVNSQNIAISLKHIYFIDKFKLILYPQVRKPYNPPDNWGHRGGSTWLLTFLFLHKRTPSFFQIITICSKFLIRKLNISFMKMKFLSRLPVPLQKKRDTGQKSLWSHNHFCPSL